MVVPTAEEAEGSSDGQGSLGLGARGDGAAAAGSLSETSAPRLTRSFRPQQAWLQTDFREERKWKTVLAYEMAEWVMEWHHSDDKASLCVRVGQPKSPKAAPPPELADPAASSFDAGVPLERVDNDDDDMDIESDEDAVAPVKSISATPSAAPPLPPPQVADLNVDLPSLLPDSMEGIAPSISSTAPPPAVPLDRPLEPSFSSDAVPTGPLPDPKEALGDADAEGEEDDAFGEVDLELLGQPVESGLESQTGQDPSALSTALRPGSDDPALTLSEDPQDAARQLSEQISLARSTLFSTEVNSLTLDLSPFTYPSAIPSTLDLSNRVLHDLFGDTGHYTMGQPVSDSASLSGRMDRRLDDATTSAGKLAATSRLLGIRPVLVSTLQPSKKRKLGRWEDLSDLWGPAERDALDFNGADPPLVASSRQCCLFSRPLLC